VLPIADHAQPAAAKVPPASRLIRRPLPSLTHSYPSCARYVCNDCIIYYALHQNGKHYANLMSIRLSICLSDFPSSKTVHLRTVTSYVEVMLDFDLQHAQNAAARMIFNLGSHEHVMPCLIQLHWLPVLFRIAKRPSREVSMLSAWHESDTTSYVTPRLRIKFGERTFSFSGPAAWNSLPADLRTGSDITDFKSKLKAHLFGHSENIVWSCPWQILGAIRADAREGARAEILLFFSIR